MQRLLLAPPARRHAAILLFSVHVLKFACVLPDSPRSPAASHPARLISYGGNAHLAIADDLFGQGW